ncbi:right-handed parallel beta-helix repeat-containing protein [uncultured Thiodictyon sp.]|uniref:right-handed parallel beta-helix repeat-containing protein n=1 Tax=uncultured Thiodictyon sp. TaxID=1846217 RepID=UPI0025F7E54A|nr:right-handed parallel beta-helix repeat-containing protein [uncultured Thiodictyon sp.]
MTGQQQTIIDCTPADGWDGIAAALARARPGERVRCAAGDYRGTTSLRVPGGVTLAGVPGTHLIWAGEGSAVRVDGVAGVVIEGIEVLGGEGPRAQTVPEESLDAPILVVDCTRVKIADCAVSGGGEYLHGILIRLCSGVAIEDCRALDCRNGILIESSIDTTADRNLCGNNRRAGIGATRDSEHPERPCHCRFTGNRCHHNQRHGIAFHSSQGLARDNECWANARSGISLERDSITPNAPANADLIGNQCHHNQQTGITFLSSQGIARDNDCWANARSGISLERNSDARDGPDAPANPELIGNRCHHNLEAGILFTSSQGRAENNDCWGSHTRSGIVIQRGTDTRNVPANAELIDNRCHDNQQGGIDFLSSDGSTEGNHCWGNRVSDPIRQQREWRDQKRYYLGELPACSVQVGSHFTSPPAPATRRNRPLVEALTEFGIDRPEPLADFLRSGCLDCFGRFWSGDSAARTTDPERAAPTVQETGPIDPNAPRVYFYSQDPQGRVKLERKRHYGKPKAAKPPQPPLSATLAGFVETWLKAVTHNEWDKVHPPTHPANDRTPATAPQNRADPRQKQPAPHQHPGLAWNLALVSARPTSLDHWLHGLEADREQHLHSITRRWADAHIAPDRPPRLADPLVVDLTGWSGGKDGLRQKAEQEILVDRGRRIEQSRGDQAKSAGGAAALLDEGTRLEALGRRHERRRELWLLPMGWKLILLLLPALLLLVAGLALLGIPTAGKLLTGFLHQGPGAWPTLTHQLAHALWDAFGKLKLGYQVVWVLMPVAALTTWLDAFNLPLPRRLHVHPRGIRGVALALVKKVVADPTDILVDQKHIARLMTRLDEAASRRWLRHRLFGHLGRRSDLALLVLRGLDRLPRQDEAPRAKQDKAVQPRQEDADWLRELPWLARQRQGLLLVTQMGDLSHLVGAWFPQLQPPKPGGQPAEPAAAQPSPAPIWDRALLVHEPGAARGSSRWRQT